MNKLETFIAEQAAADEAAGIQRDKDSWRRLVWNAAIEATLQIASDGGTRHRIAALRVDP